MRNGIVQCDNTLRFVRERRGGTPLIITALTIYWAHARHFAMLYIIMFNRHKLIREELPYVYYE